MTCRASGDRSLGGAAYGIAVRCCLAEVGASSSNSEYAQDSELDRGWGDRRLIAFRAIATTQGFGVVAHGDKSFVGREVFYRMFMKNVWSLARCAMF